ncbi:hypothetical protein [Bacillus sp. KH172YL63]|uniref:hypothetical protein n=1 Tax=Bacillus sp. KH172YL63 TaxID=2709784 RepID=UPI0013E4C8AC|nr:hypothetical protein [Bacillus sp. KH172YL63]BCB03716.1 hypothetical protein KH172YL63_18490 [Bacillus sp. KH172YL63]
MKKLMLPFLLLSMSLFIAACSSDEGGKEEGEMEKETTEETAQNDEGEMKTALLDFQMEVIDTVNANDSAIYAFETAKAKEEDKPSAEEIAKLKTDAEAAAKKVAEDVKALEVPAALDSKKEEIQGALDDLSSSYETRAANLSDEADAEYAESDEKFASFEEKMAAVYEEVGLSKPSFAADIVD